MALEQNHFKLLLVNSSKSGIFAMYPKHNLGITETNKLMHSKRNCKENTQFCENDQYSTNFVEQDSQVT